MRKTMKRYAETRGTRGIVRQAHRDISRGLVDTDLRGRSSKKKKQTAATKARGRAAGAR
jgi:hypothetical protein